MKFYTTATIAASVAAFLTAQAMAATTTPLAPGKPAGVHHAQGVHDLLLPLAIAGVAIGVVVVASGNGNGNLTSAPVVPPPATSTT